MKFSERFIKASDDLCDFEEHIPAPYLRKRFEIDFIPEKAEITICGLGFYELYINGENVTKGFLAPYISNPDHICYYDNYDITKKLHKGENVIGILLGNGFRNAFGGFVWDFDKADCRGPAVTALCLEAEGDGKSFMMEADNTFKIHSSPIIFNDLRMGCYYDARLEIPHWSEVDFDDSEWMYAQIAEKPAGEARLCEVEPIVVTEKIQAIDIKYYEELPFAYKTTLIDAEPIQKTIRKNVYVYDFGVNGAGITMLRINGYPGQKITIRHAECLQNDNFAMNTVIFNRPETLDKYLEYAQKDIYICKGGEECFLPKFKYDGFRYAFVEGLEPEQATKEAITYLVMNSDIKARAEFSCSDDTLNKLFKMTRRSDLSNFYYFPTDCPHREKNGWTGDASVSVEHLLLNFECARSIREWLANIRKAQRVDGALPGIVPTGDWGYEDLNGPAWDSVCVNLPYYIYKYEGNIDVIIENSDMIMRYLRYAFGKKDGRGLVAFGLGDWIDPFKSVNGYIASPLEFTDSVEIYDIAVKAAYLFEKAELEKEREYALGVARNMRDAIRRNLIDFDTMTVVGNCQTSQAVAIEMGIFNENEIERARERLVKIIHRDGDVNTCGMIGLRYIFHALTNAGETELAAKIITSKERSCYGAWIERGATALLENFPYPDGRELCSHNHHFLGDISSWMIQELAGIKPNPNVCDINTFEISPRFIEMLSHVQGEYRTANGSVKLKWNRIYDIIELNISVPEGILCELKIDNKYCKLQNNKITELREGEYTFTFISR